MRRPLAPGLPDRRGALAARVRVFYRTTGPMWHGSRIERIESIEVDLRGAGVGGQADLEEILHQLIPAGAELRGYELIA